MAFLRPGHDLSLMNVFKVIHVGKMMDVSNISQPSVLAALFALDSQFEHEGEKHDKDAIVVMTSARDAPGEKLAFREGQ